VTVTVWSPAIVVMSVMTMSFIERTREFGVLSVIGRTGRRRAAVINARDELP
jgi:hypothetical protein